MNTSRNVKVNSFDDMKIVYFLGIEAFSLYGENNFLLNMVKILSQISATKRGKFINREMYQKILDSINSFIFGISFSIFLYTLSCFNSFSTSLIVETIGIPKPLKKLSSSFG